MPAIKQSNDSKCMYDLKRAAVCFSVFFVALFLSSGFAQAKKKPEIKRAGVDMENEVIYIYGFNFGKEPAVKLGDDELQVIWSSKEEIIAWLPDAIAERPGTYRLIVTADKKKKKKKKTDPLDVTIGTVGSKGDTGDTGPRGEQGPAGPKGDTGEAGLQGPKGDTGDTGPRGVQGPAGPKGDTGDAGLQGPKGDTGDTGPRGVQGPAGPKGDTGEAGLQGPKGDTGDTGPRGVQGPAGPKGDTGNTGEQGSKGDSGDTGPRGEQGPVGPKGDTGDAGQQGPKGDKGDTGECDCPITQEQLDELVDRIEYLESIFRFTDLGDGTVRDNDTGLIWLKNASCSEMPDTNSGTADWLNAMAAAQALMDGVCGLTDGSTAGDWRLPTQSEWEAFMSEVYDYPALVNALGNRQCSEGDPFIGVQSTYYWSSSEIDSGHAWGTAMHEGATYWINKASRDYVWPVRSGH